MAVSEAARGARSQIQPTSPTVHLCAGASPTHRPAYLPNPCLHVPPSLLRSRRTCSLHCLSTSWTCRPSHAACGATRSALSAGKLPAVSCSASAARPGFPPPLPLLECTERHCVLGHFPVTHLRQSIFDGLASCCPPALLYFSVAGPTCKFPCRACPAFRAGLSALCFSCQLRASWHLATSPQWPSPALQRVPCQITPLILSFMTSLVLQFSLYTRGTRVLSQHPLPAACFPHPAPCPPCVDAPVSLPLSRGHPAPLQPPCCLFSLHSLHVCSL